MGQSGPIRPRPTPRTIGEGKTTRKRRLGHPSKNKSGPNIRQTLGFRATDGGLVAAGNQKTAETPLDALTPAHRFGTLRSSQEVPDRLLLAWES